MRVAVICLAYLQKPGGVGLLAKYFERTQTDVFLHVDAKVSVDAYASVVAKYPNLHLLADRKEIFWGGFNTVRALVSALEVARKTGPYDRYLMMTEDTIPLVSSGQFTELMAYPGELFECRKTTSPEVHDRYAKFFYFDSFSVTPRPCQIVQREVSTQMLLDMQRLQRVRERGKTEILTLYHGTVWGGLSAAAVNKIIVSFHQDDFLRESFEFSAIPEEQYFHTILGDLPGQLRLVYTDWTRSPKPYVFKDIGEIKAVDARGSIFLRKVPVDSPEISSFVDELG